MGTVPCRHCNKQVAGNCTKCPHCGGDELDPDDFNSTTEQSQVNGNESPITEVPDFTRDQALSQVSKLKKKNGNDFAVIAVILTVASLLVTGTGILLILTPLCTILHAVSLAMLLRMQSGKLTPTPAWITVGIITGAINVYILLMGLAPWIVMLGTPARTVSIGPSTQQPTASQIIFPVAGTITYDGKPLTGARIRLEAAGRRASRVYACDSKPNGTFEIVAVYSTGVKSGAPIGNYKVLVGKWEKDETDSDELGFEEALELELIEEESEVAPAPKSLILEKFSNSSLTPLKLEVKEGKNSFRIDLKSDGTGTVKAL